MDGMNDHHHNPTVSARIAELIKRQIAEGTLRPGDRLPAERELALQLGVARSPLREALRELKAQGFLAPGKGRQRTLVASVADVTIGDPLARLLRSGSGQFLDLIELRQGLEVQAAGLAARRRTPADVADLRGILAKMEGAQGRRHTLEAAKLDAAFHGTVANTTHNVLYMHVTAELVRLLHENIPRILDILYTNLASARDLLDQHRRIVEAIEEGDEEGARGAMSEHLAHVLRDLEKIDGRSTGLPGNEVTAEPPGRRPEPSPLDRDLVD